MFAEFLAGSMFGRYKILKAARLRLGAVFGSSNDDGHLVDIRLSQHISLYDWEVSIRRRAKCIYVGEQTLLARALGRYPIFLDSRDVGFATHLAMDGYWELGLARFMISRLKPGWTCVDVGANFGFYTLIMADMVGTDGHVVAVEPNPSVSERLSRSVAVNGFSERVSLHCRAVTDQNDQSLTFVIPSGEPKNGHLSSLRDGPIPHGDSSITVRSSTLDSIVENFNRVSFVKIDAEGSEEMILAGMKNTLMQHRPELLLEYNFSRANFPRQMLEALSSTYQQPPRFVKPDGTLAAVSVDTLLSAKIREDWMLFFAR